MGIADNARNGIRIGLVGDFSADVPAHQAIPLALHRAADAAQVAVDIEWLPTPQIGTVRTSRSSMACGASRLALIGTCWAR